MTQVVTEREKLTPTRRKAIGAYAMEGDSIDREELAYGAHRGMVAPLGNGVTAIVTRVRGRDPETGEWTV